MAISFDGWIKVFMEIRSEQHRQVAIQIPLLVGRTCVTSPLLGFNVIEETIMAGDKHSSCISLLDCPRQWVSGVTQVKTLISVLNEMSSQVEPESPLVKIGNRGLTIQRGRIREVNCRLRTLPDGGVALCEPAVDESLLDGSELFPALVDALAHYDIDTKR